ncbi:related to negative regulator of glucose-repressible genes [Cephalotrichum gorgonifer]|uniref:Related to negative regulator of glucose-repressible genes n=1 Tax=Cephalotrichum gorgonifer TaxID=2041049 RepID=A0AAE8N7K8_9PEZI|nr:related to negative regulator of glucose-repressible genes [Cephalotrichum gorgonifer]
MAVDLSSEDNYFSYTTSPDKEGSGSTSRLVSLEILERAEDDTAVRAQPTRHVDYLSHSWAEEEIWSSWRYIVSRPKDYVNAVRLENALWRTWLKKKNNLKTVSPETLNWLKECDVTWLYGPLQTRENTENNVRSAAVQPRTKATSFINKKPILKKRSISEIMLRRSLSSSLLIKHAAAVVEAQEKNSRKLARPSLERAASDYVTFPFSSRRTSKDTSLHTSSTTSGSISPTSEQKRIHFNKQVEQCIAVDVKGDDDVEDTPVYMHDGGDLDNSAVVMKRTMRRREGVPILRRTSKGSDGKTIAMLPSTTIRDRQDCLEVETVMKDSTQVYVGSPIVSPSSSGSFDFETAGMRRALLEMPMLRDEVGSPTPNDGFFGRILDTMNTARDIAHVIWNFGWRN